MLGNIAQLKVSNLHKVIQVESTWDKRIRLHENDKAIQEIIFLHLYQVPTIFISSDAINHALSAQFFKGEREHICFKNFSE